MLGFWSRVVWLVQIHFVEGQQSKTIQNTQWHSNEVLIFSGEQENVQQDHRIIRITWRCRKTEILQPTATTYLKNWVQYRCPEESCCLKKNKCTVNMIIDIWTYDKTWHLSLKESFFKLLSSMSLIWCCGCLSDNWTDVFVDTYDLCLNLEGQVESRWILGDSQPAAMNHFSNRALQIKAEHK